MTKKEEKMVSLDDLQFALGVSWPPAERFVNKYGHKGTVVGDRNLTQTYWYVPESVAIDVVEKFREEAATAKPRYADGPDPNRLSAWGRTPGWVPPGGDK